MNRLGFLQSEDSESVNLAQEPRVCISNKLPGSAHGIGLRTTLYMGMF